jgi:hypothetical protein
MLPHIHYKGQRQVNKNGRSKSDERGINKEKSDTGGGHPQLFPHMRANAKGISLKKVLDLRCNFAHIIISIMFFNILKSHFNDQKSV